MKKFFFFGLLTVVFGCSDNDNQSLTLCTTEYKVLELEITDNSDRPVALEDFEVVDLSNETDISSEFLDFTEEDGFYPVASDGLNFNGASTVDLLFIGVLNNEIVVTERFEVGHDECHIFKISGKDKVVVSN